MILAILVLTWGIVDFARAFQTYSNNQYPASIPLEAIQGLVKIGVALGIAFTGLVSIFVGEVAQIFIDVEENTSRAAASMSSLRQQFANTPSVSQPLVASAAPPQGGGPLLPRPDRSLRG
jgi:hypothetical protein